MGYRTLGVCLVAMSCAQAAPRQEFAVASVKVNRPGSAGGEGSELEKIVASQTGIDLRNVSLRSAIRWAYGVREYQIAGPDWMGSLKYDIEAKSAAAASGEELRGMLQTLLADRFQLVLHRESKELPVYGMTAGKKAGKLQRSAGGESSMRPIGGALVFRNYTMAELAERLATRPFSLDRVVVDETGLDGAFDFALELADSGASLKQTLEGMASAGQSSTMVTILQEQLGLVFKARKASIDNLVVDRCEKIPTPN